MVILMLVEGSWCWASSEEKQSEVKLTSGKPIPIQIHAAPGWKLNLKAPSWLSLYQKSSLGKFQLMYQFRKDQLQNMILSPLQDQGHYQLRGTLYYCKKGERSVCQLESYDFIIDSDSSVQRARLSIESELKND